MLVIKFKHLLKILKLEGDFTLKKKTWLMNVFYGLIWKKQENIEQYVYF